MIINHLLIFFSIIHVLTIFTFFIGLFRKKNPESSDLPFISIVVALKNEEDNLKDLINGLKNQNYPKDKYEILLVDNASDDNTHQHIEEMVSDLPQFKSLTTKNYQSDLQYKKEAMMMGIENSKGEIILSTDADCAVQTTWISSMASQYNEHVDMVIGFSEVISDNSIFLNLQKLDFLQLMAAAKGSLNLGFKWAGSGQNISFRKNAFYNCNGYENLKTLKGGDDTLFIQKFAKKNSGKIIFSSNTGSYVKTKGINDFPTFIRQRIRWASEANYTRKFNLIVFFISLAAFIANIGILYYFILSLVTGNYWTYFLGLGFLKYFAENMLAIKASEVFNVKNVLSVFPIWFIIYPTYALFLGLMSFVGKNVKWK